MVAVLGVDMTTCQCRSLTRLSLETTRPLQSVRPTGSTSSDAMWRMGAERTATERKLQGPEFEPAQPKFVDYETIL